MNPFITIGGYRINLLNVTSMSDASKSISFADGKTISGFSDTDWAALVAHWDSYAIKLPPPSKNEEAEAPREFSLGDETA